MHTLCFDVPDETMEHIRELMELAGAPTPGTLIGWAMAVYHLLNAQAAIGNLPYIKIADTPEAGENRGKLARIKLKPKT